MDIRSNAGCWQVLNSNSSPHCAPFSAQASRKRLRHPLGVIPKPDLRIENQNILFRPGPTIFGDLISAKKPRGGLAVCKVSRLYSNCEVWVGLAATGFKLSRRLQWGSSGVARLETAVRDLRSLTHPDSDAFRAFLQSTNPPLTNLYLQQHVYQ